MNLNFLIRLITVQRWINPSGCPESLNGGGSFEKKHLAQKRCQNGCFFLLSLLLLLLVLLLLGRNIY